MERRTSVLVPAVMSDLPLIDRWLTLPSIRRWWGSPVTTQIEMRLGIYARNEIGRVFLIHDQNDQPVGLVSVIHTKALARSPLDWPKYLPAQAWEIGILIADRSNRRRGHAIKALREVQRFVFNPPVDPVFAGIEKENKASLAVFARLGYRRVYEKETAAISTALFQFDPAFDRETSL